jgi:predicted porin
MKKSLLAVAVAAALPAVATAQVTINGLLDVAYGSASGERKGQTFSTRDFVSATSNLQFNAVEKIGDLTATVQYAFDPRRWFNDESNEAATLPAPNNNQQVGGGLITRNESFLGLAGGFGNVRLGSPNSVGLTTFLIASPLGTGIGSGYAELALDYSFVRFNRSIRYDTPSIAGGFSAAISYAPGGDDPTTDTLRTAGGILRNANENLEFGVRYDAGPLSVGYAHVTQPKRRDGSVSPAVSRRSTSTNVVAARYTIGTTQLSGGFNDGDNVGRTTAGAPYTESKGWRLGVSHGMAPFTLIASYGEQENKSTAAGAKVDEEKILGLRVDYSLSKRSVVYLGYQDTSDNRTSATRTGVTNRDLRLLGIGMRHTF